MGRIKLVNALKYQYDIRPNEVLDAYNGNLIVAMKIDKDTYLRFIDNNHPIEVNDVPLAYARIISYGKPFNYEGFISLDEMIAKFIRHNIFYHIPNKFNTDDRTFENFVNHRGIEKTRWVETTREKYYKYHIALLGNPEYILVIEIDKEEYINSDYYKNLENHVAEPV